jgi:2-polyprenyl-3-methyl-5-hydroxy-6-metoxy-1,4-benzoquinol methylase
MQDPWDLLSAKFNSATPNQKIDPDAADNILIAWPPIVEQIKKQFGKKKTITILDYGCGTGAFCQKLHELGYKNVTGLDSSSRMINTAQKNYGTHITFLHAGIDTVDIDPPDLIAGIMVFQFIENIEAKIQNLSEALQPGGLLIFAVHNPGVVTAGLERKKKLFSDFDLTQNPTCGLIHLGDVTIPIYIRTASEYDAIAKRAGLTKVYEAYPPFTKEFLAQYKTEVPDISNFMILGYTK